MTTEQTTSVKQFPPSDILFACQSLWPDAFTKGKYRHKSIMRFRVVWLMRTMGKPCPSWQFIADRLGGLDGSSMSYGFYRHLETTTAEERERDIQRVLIELGI